MNNKVIDTIVNNNQPLCNTLVAYVDGSCKHMGYYTPACGLGYIGSGIHGYMYTTEDINKSSNDKPKNTLITTEGYIKGNKSILPTVTPYCYLDICVPLKEVGTSNVAELMAVEHLLSVVLDKGDINNIIVYSDSSYTLLSIDNLLTKGESYLTEETPNVKILTSLLNKLNKLKANNITYKFNKIKAHQGELGNELADRLAVIAAKSSLNPECDTIANVFNITKGVKYWDINIKPNPLIDFKQLFFITGDDNYNSNTYSVLNYSTGTDVGKKTHEACFGLVKLNKEVDTSSINGAIYTYVEGITNIWWSNPPISVATINLHNLYSRDNILYHNMFGNNIYTYNKKNMHLYNVFSKPIVYRVFPAVLATQALEKMQYLEIILDRLTLEVPNTKTLTYIDITDKLYETVTTKKTSKLSCLIPQSEPIIKLEVVDNITKEEYLIPIELGKDILSRNQLKQLESTMLNVYIVIKRDSDKVRSYYTIVKTTEGIAIYCNFYSGKLFLNEMNYKLIQR